MRNKLALFKRMLSLMIIGMTALTFLHFPMEAEAKKSSSSSTYTEGDDIAFGYIDGVIMSWTILSYDDTTKTALIVARKSLSSYMVRSYKQAIVDLYTKTKTTAGYVRWEDNYWRGWCNQIFYNQCFSDAERAMIQKTSLTAKSSQTSLMNYYHDTTLDASYVAGNVKNSLNMNIYNNQSTTSDYIFFLSSDEFTSYKDNMKYESNCIWPLRTNAYDDPSQGLFANDSDQLIYRQYYYSGDGVRPAMYIKLGETEDATDTDSSSSSTSSTTGSTSTASTTSTTSTASATTTSSSTTSSTSVVRSKKYANNATSVGNVTLPDDSQYTMTRGSTAQTALNLEYLNASDKQYTVTYKSSNSSVFTVDSGGVITANGTGTATLTVRMTKSNGKTYTMTCRIDVN